MIGPIEHPTPTGRGFPEWASLLFLAALHGAAKLGPPSDVLACPMNRLRLIDRIVSSKRMGGVHGEACQEGRQGGQSAAR